MTFPPNLCLSELGRGETGPGRIMHRVYQPSLARFPKRRWHAPGFLPRVRCMEFGKKVLEHTGNLLSLLLDLILMLLGQIRFMESPTLSCRRVLTYLSCCTLASRPKSDCRDKEPQAFGCVLEQTRLPRARPIHGPYRKSKDIHPHRYWPSVPFPSHF